MKKVADWLPIIIPLLITSLEKAFLLSESMAARGFHAHHGTRNSRPVSMGLVLAAFSVFSGWILNVYDYPKWLGGVLYVFGGSCFVLLLFIQGRQTRVTHYRQEDWHMKDILASLLFAGISIAFIILVLNGRLSSLSYSPYMALSFPSFQWLCLLFCVMSLFPVFLEPND
jgi:hypothetical protein